jgi:hypothetical protein
VSPSSALVLPAAPGRKCQVFGAALNAEQVPTLSGRGAWAKSSVRHVLARFDSEQDGNDPPQ